MAASTNTTGPAGATADGMKLIVGYDGSECGDAAVRDLRRGGLPARGEALVLSVADLSVEVPYPGYGPQGEPAAGSPAVSPAAVREARALAAAAMDEARRQSARGAELVRSLFPGWTVRDEAPADSPYWGLIQRAGEWSADLVVVGSHGRPALQRLMLGSVSQFVLAHAPCSVRVGRCAPPGAAPAAGVNESVAPDRPVRILLAVDGSPDSALAAEAVRVRAWPAGSEVRVVAVMDLRLRAALAARGPWAEHWLAGDQEAIAVARRGVGAVADELRAAGLVADTVVLDGDPKRVLAAEAERWGADCIFVGAQGHTRLERLLLGSVSAAVAARANCSVEVVRLG